MDRANREAKRADFSETELDFRRVLHDLSLIQHLTVKHWADLSARLVAYSGMEMLLFDIKDREDVNHSSLDEAYAVFKSDWIVKISNGTCSPWVFFNFVCR